MLRSDPLLKASLQAALMAKFAQMVQSEYRTVAAAN